MRRSAAFALLLSLSLGATTPVRSYTVQLADPAGEFPIKWSRRRIPIALSSSLTSPTAAIKAGTDVLGALRRAMSRWSTVANIQFVEVPSKFQSISPASAGDGVSLITIADTPENEALFNGGGNTGRTRVFYDPSTGTINEADVVINPRPMSADGAALQFSSDETPGTYDLESAFTHELGHLLGLEHSGVIAATMQARQRLNGSDHSTSTTSRTLSEDDRAAIRSIYGPHEGLGVIEGRLQDSTRGTSAPVFGAHVWAENTQTGRVIASSVSLADGRYRIESLPPASYRVMASFLDGAVNAEDIASAGGAYTGIEKRPGFQATELGNQVNVAAGTTSSLNWNIVPPQDGPPALKPKVLGVKGQLSSVAVPVEAGKTYKLFVGGEGIDQVPGGSISSTSPFISINAASLSRQTFGASFPVISIEITIAPNTPFGDYSLRFQSSSGEVAYLAGGLTVDPGVDTEGGNPLDDPDFFVKQQYRDFLGRNADLNGLTYWRSQISECANDVNCIRDRRVEVSAAFFAEKEFQETGSFVYRLYKLALGRRPDFGEFLTGRGRIVSTANLQANKQAFAEDFANAPEVRQKYPRSMNANQFVDALLLNASRTADLDLSSQRTSLLALYDGTVAGRVAVIRQLADSSAFTQAEYKPAYVLMQYFGYLRRNPDESGFNFWLNVLQSKPDSDSSAYRAMVCSFLSSAEYQARFGMMLTHNDGECGR